MGGEGGGAESFRRGLTVNSGSVGGLSSLPGSLTILTGSATMEHSAGNALCLASERARLEVLPEAEPAQIVSLAEPVGGYRPRFFIGPNELRAAPSLAAYLHERTRPFAPGTPWQEQLAAAQGLKKPAARKTIERMLASAGLARRTP